MNTFLKLAAAGLVIAQALIAGQAEARTTIGHPLDHGCTASSGYPYFTYGPYGNYCCKMPDSIDLSDCQAVQDPFASVSAGNGSAQAMTFLQPKTPSGTDESVLIIVPHDNGYASIHWTVGLNGVAVGGDTVQIGYDDTDVELDPGLACTGPACSISYRFRFRTNSLGEIVGWEFVDEYGLIDHAWDWSGGYVI